MNKNKQTTKNRKGRHLTYGKRCRIETLLAEGQSMRYIAECVGCSPSTVSREIKQHSFIQKSHTNDCLNKSNCHKHNVCGGISCRKSVKLVINARNTVPTMYRHTAPNWKQGFCATAATNCCTATLKRNCTKLISPRMNTVRCSSEDVTVLI